jgi:hypothetical protein
VSQTRPLRCATSLAHLVVVEAGSQLEREVEAPH